ncbi:MAG: PA0069 family radical SAM protein [Bacteroidota bacterium]
MENQISSGRGTLINPQNKFRNNFLGKFHKEGIDDFEFSLPRTVFINEYPKSIVSKNDSPDIPFDFSINPYQGCEHGCVYCYARESHQFWGYSAGLDFESKIIVKHNAPELLEKTLLNPKWKVAPITFSGNTDCYQPAERKYKITRELLKICLKYRNPVSIITKNMLILRDIDILTELASRNLVHVVISVTTFNEELRRNLEPRSVTADKRLKTVKKLTEAGIPTGVMIAPIIPGLNINEVPLIIERAAEAGAFDVSHTVLRLNGAIEEIFINWLKAVYPEKAQKILTQVQSIHGGKVNDSRFMKRMLGEGKIADMISQMMKIGRKRYFKNPGFPAFDTSKFRMGGMYTIW